MVPYFSIILPIYNVELYLERCIRSILGQEFKDYELILVDDGSTDKSKQICDEFEKQYEHIKVIHKKNGGLSSARNAGLSIAKGKYIWWVDSDDWIERDALSVLYQATLDREPDVVKFNYIRVEQQHMLVKGNVEDGFYRNDAIDVLKDKAFFSTSQFGLSAWASIYSRDFLYRNNLSFLSERIVGSEDYLFNLEVLMLAESIKVISDALYFYEQRMGSLSQRYKKELPERYTKLYIRLKEFCCGIGAWEEHEKKINSFYIWHLLHGTCIPNEYYISNDHTVQEGRTRIRKFLKTVEFQEAVRKYDSSKFSCKQRVQIWAMKQRLEPLFYWLYVVKPKLRKELFG